MGVLRCEPSNIFWFLISRRFNDSNACEGLGLVNLQKLCTCCMASNHNGFPELWACVLTPKDVLLCYNCSWVQNTFLLSKGVGSVHTWHGQTGTKNSSTAGFCLWHFDYNPASNAHATSLCLGNRQSHEHTPCLYPAGGVLLLSPDHNLTSQIKFGIHSWALLLYPCESQEQRAVLHGELFYESLQHPQLDPMAADFQRISSGVLELNPF